MTHPHAELYIHGRPSAQAAVDVFKGEWSSFLPPETGAVSGGPAHLFDDGRIHWLLERLGNIQGWNVFEIGPLEGGHTCMLCRAGARVTAVEMHFRAWMRCLCARELIGYTGARFLLGDGIAELEASSDPYALIVASGVLYHLQDPLRLIEAAAARAPRLFLWTHVHDAAVIASRPEVAAQFTGPWEARFRGNTLRGRRRVYAGEHDSAAACTGPDAGSVWMERDSLENALRLAGYNRLTAAFEDPGHPNGPALALLAERS